MAKQEKLAAERLRIERAVIKEAFEAQILDMEQYVDSTLITKIGEACQDEPSKKS